MVRSAKGGGGQGQSGSRKLTVRVRTAKGRKIASTRWLQRQLNDPYVEEAKRQGYRSRAAFKLAEIDDKYHLLKPGMIVVDLGAAPGGWSQIAAQRVGLTAGKGKVSRSTWSTMEPIPGVTQLTLDMTDADSPGPHPRGLGRQAGRCRSVRHACPGDGAQIHRPFAHHEFGRGRARSRRGDPGAGRRVSLQGAARRAPTRSWWRASTAPSPRCGMSSRRPRRANSAEMYVLATGFRGAAET